MTAMIIPGYRIIDRLYSGSRTEVYRAVCESDQQPAVIKLLKNEHPTFNELLLFRNQYTIAKNLDFPGIVKHLKLENSGNSFALVMEDFGGISLSEYIESTRQQNNSSFPLPGGISEFLHTVIQIARTLENLYTCGVIHKDIKPQNVLINPQTKQIKLIDFSISSLLPRENQEIANPNVLEGTLAYMSPEQTGRMNRGIDYRTDYYSLGVTFYELLTGQLPFESADPMELIHCHIARMPAPPIAINPAIPQVLNDIAMKLMAKTAEERYQTAFGVRCDLEKCLAQYSSQGCIPAFKLGERDISERFAIPEKLYGRETEVASLLAAFDRVSAGTTEIVLVAGFSGIGKTAAINEVHKPIVRQRGYFIKGKFDQFQRDIPFSAWVQAFQNLMQQLLSESAATLQKWQTKILEALGENSQVIIDVIPELELLIGKQPPVPVLEGTAAQNRFNLLFEKFIRVFATVEHPLVIFLDDLQWADSASLKLMQLLCGQTNSRYLLLIGAYRDNEVSAAHPLILTLDEIRKAGATVNQITLAPLEQASLNRLISDTLCCPPQRAVPLTKQVFAKTKGNPFFATQLLKSLQVDGLISFDFSCRYWQCDIARVMALTLTDDVVEFMALKLKKLPEPTQAVLKLAACIGNQFDLATLSIVSEKSQAETAADLWRALQEGTVIPVSDVYKLFQAEDNELSPIANDENSLHLAISDAQLPAYKFLHDRVQQAAYSLIPKDQKQLTHLKIGQLLSNNTSVEEREEKIFDIVNQLNIGAGLISDRTQRDELAQLNAIAGRKAKTSTAYAAAARYLTAGRELLAADSWQQQYELTLSLYEEAAEVAYLNGDLEQMEHSIEVVLQQAQTLLEKVKVYEIKIQATAQNNLLEAVQMALSVLEMLGVTFPDSPNAEDIQQALQETLANLSDRSIEDLIDLPEMTDPYKLKVIAICSSMLTATYIAAPALLPLIVFKQVNLSLQYGNTALSGVAYCYGGLLLGSMAEEIERGYQMGQLALKILERFRAKEHMPAILVVFNATIRIWKEHIARTVQPFEATYQIGLEVGELAYGPQGVYLFAFHSLVSGENLEELKPKLGAYCEALIKYNVETFLNYARIYYQAHLNLIGSKNGSYELIGEAYNEEVMLPLHIKNNDRYAVFAVSVIQLYLCYLFGESDRALENADRAEQYIDGGPSTLLIHLFHFYDSLAQLAIYPNTSTAFEQQQILKKVAAHQEKMKKWAGHAPMNYLHKYYLVEAERHRVLGENLEAMDCYDRAIATAKENEYIQDEGLANELAAKFYLAWGKQTIGTAYLTNSYYCYARWGAKAKVQDLEQRYPLLLAAILVQPTTPKQGETLFQTIASTVTSQISGSNSSSVFDLTAVLKASQALSSEIDLSKLLSTLMQVVLENAGASKCALILSDAGKLVIEATGVSGTAQTKVLQSIPVEQSREIPVTVINYVYRTSQTLVLDNASIQNTFSADPYIINTQPKSVLCAPIVDRGKSIGILYLENNLTTKAFTRERLEVLKILSAQAAISITNAKLYAEVSASERRLTQFFEAMPIGVSVHEPTGQIYYANQTAQQLLGISVLPEAGTEQLSEVYQVYRAGTDRLYPTDLLPLARSLSGEPANADDLELHQPDKVIPLEVSSTPIFDETGNLVYAIAAFQDITQRKEAEKLLAEYNQTLEGQVKERTAQLEAANQEIMALNERLTTENLRMSAELGIAKQLQQMVLPKPEECHAIADLDIAGFMQPADEVGGDYYDVLNTDNVATIAIGDVTGHGLESGILMLMTQTAVRTLKEIQENDPVRFLDTLNRTIYKNLQRMNCDRNLTLAILNYAEGKLSISGQHEEILVVRNGGQIERIDTVDLGFPIGLDGDIADLISHELVELEPGDGVVLYTDGITEARDIDRQFYGLARLCEVVAMNWHKSAKGIEQAVIDDLRGFIGEQQVFDDITLVVLKRTDG
ncbi:MAG: AAA family ATPase [Oscillatoriaceae cyanobacterium Prado104]|jgi:PAS domain S-box-containing protein|nr:AAA family ATPase [Oscillatoriaceae cyanobacterium Prado104]